MVTDYSAPLGEADGAAAGQPLPAGEDRSDSGALDRGQEADRLLRRPRGARADPHAPWSRARRWWAEAFDTAGYIDAFRVEVLPEGADPLDARYNVINWVNRATRSWSYGQSVVDPRTGEIVKGSGRCWARCGCGRTC